MGDHRVTIRLEYTDAGRTIPWKRRGRCTCGWQCLSWDGLRPILSADEHVREAARYSREARQAACDRMCEQVLRERDEAEEWADRLAYAIAPVEVIGEHSSVNNPWQNALNQIGAALTSPAPGVAHV